MKRASLNFWVDALAFAALLVLVSTGMVLEYQLPAGSGGREAAAMGRGAVGRPVELLWGWTRHEWGAFHFWTAWALLAILAVHLALHWKWIVCVVQGKPSDASGGRLALGALGLVGAVGLAVIPLLSGTETTTRGALARERAGAAARPDGREADEADASLWLRGSMTLGEVAAACGKPVDWLIAELGLPADSLPTERIGRLLRANGLEMSDLRALVATSPEASP